MPSTRILTHGLRGLVPALAAMLFATGPSLAQSPDPSGEDALTRQADDAALEWGPCPAFMPRGCAVSVLHGDPTENRADVFFRLPAGEAVDRHWHTSAERMVLVSGTMSVDYDGQDAVTLETGSYAYGPPELPHTAECVSGADCVLYIGFNEPVDAFATDPGE